MLKKLSTNGRVRLYVEAELTRSERTQLEALTVSISAMLGIAWRFGSDQQFEAGLVVTQGSAAACVTEAIIPIKNLTFEDDFEGGKPFDPGAGRSMVHAILDDVIAHINRTSKHHLRMEVIIGDGVVSQEEREVA